MQSITKHPIILHKHMKGKSMINYDLTINQKDFLVKIILASRFLNLDHYMCMSTRLLRNIS